MLEIIQAIVLGIVRGLTEFLPISSSAHLVIVPWLFGWAQPSLLFDTMLHWGMVLAVVVVFWRDFLALIAAWFRSIARLSLADPSSCLPICGHVRCMSSVCTVWSSGWARLSCRL